MIFSMTDTSTGRTYAVDMAVESHTGVNDIISALHRYTSRINFPRGGVVAESDDCFLGELGLETCLSESRFLAAGANGRMQLRPGLRFFVGSAALDFARRALDLSHPYRTCVNFMNDMNEGRCFNYVPPEGKSRIAAVVEAMQRFDCRVTSISHLHILMCLFRDHNKSPQDVNTNGGLAFQAYLRGEVARPGDFEPSDCVVPTNLTRMEQACVLYVAAECIRDMRMKKLECNPDNIIVPLPSKERLTSRNLGAGPIFADFNCSSEDYYVCALAHRFIFSSLGANWKLVLKKGPFGPELPSLLSFRPAPSSSGNVAQAEREVQWEERERRWEKREKQWEEWVQHQQAQVQQQQEWAQQWREREQQQQEWAQQQHEWEQRQQQQQQQRQQEWDLLLSTSAAVSEATRASKKSISEEKTTQELQERTDWEARLMDEIDRKIERQSFQQIVRDSIALRAPASGGREVKSHVSIPGLSDLSSGLQAAAAGGGASKKELEALLERKHAQWERKMEQKWELLEKIESVKREEWAKRVEAKWDQVLRQVEWERRMEEKFGHSVKSKKAVSRSRAPHNPDTFSSDASLIKRFEEMDLKFAALFLDDSR